MRFHPATALTPDDGQILARTVQRRVLRAFRARGLLRDDAAADMLSWRANGGFSVDASVRVEGEDRAGLERLVRYCARPPLALELLARLSRLLPPPRIHRQRYHGVLAPHAGLRAQVVAIGREARDEERGVEEAMRRLDSLPEGSPPPGVPVAPSGAPSPREQARRRVWRRARLA